MGKVEILREKREVGLAEKVGAKKHRRLVDLGKWEIFVGREKELVMMGLGEDEAIESAYDEAIGHGEERKRNVKMAEAVDKGKRGIGKSGKKLKNYKGEWLVCEEFFVGKRCSRASAIEWAYVHCGMMETSPLQAPSALAWCLLEDFRKSANYKFDLFKSVASKAVAKEDLDDVARGRRIDGQWDFDILERLGGDDVESLEKSLGIGAKESDERDYGDFIIGGEGAAGGVGGDAGGSGGVVGGDTGDVGDGVGEGASDGGESAVLGEADVGSGVGGDL